VAKENSDLHIHFPQIAELFVSEIQPCNREFRRKKKSRKRRMGGGHGEGITYKGVTLHKPKRWHTVTGKGLCAVMWFWVFYRAKQDGPVVLGWRHPWEGHDDHH
ncbi:sensor protein kinase WalK, partial [Striga asiatica]